MPFLFPILRGLPVSEQRQQNRKMLVATNANRLRRRPPQPQPQPLLQQRKRQGVILATREQADILIAKGYPKTTPEDMVKFCNEKGYELYVVPAEKVLLDMKRKEMKGLAD